MSHTISTKRLHAAGYDDYSFDKRKRRRQHRQAARNLRRQWVRHAVSWHLNNARYLGR